MKNKFSYTKKNRYKILTIFVILMIVVGILLSDRIIELQESYVERQLAQQTQIMAELVQERLGAELSSMNLAARLIESGAVQEVRKMEGAGVLDGLMALDGTAIYGEVLDFSIYEGIRESFRGNEAVSCDEEGNIVFSVPVFRGDNVKYVLYRKYTKNQLEQFFWLGGRRCEGKVFGGKWQADIVCGCPLDTGGYSDAPGQGGLGNLRRDPQEIKYFLIRCRKGEIFWGILLFLCSTNQQEGAVSDRSSSQKADGGRNFLYCDDGGVCAGAFDSAFCHWGSLSL